MKHTIGFLFDMDGVLVDSNPYHKIALQQFCAQHGFLLTEEQLRTTIYGRTNRAWLTNLFGQLSEADLARYADEKESLFRDLFREAIRPLNGLTEFLSTAKTAGVPMAIATSAPRANVDFTLAACGLEGYFDAILDDSFVTHGKPDPEIYLKSAAALQLDPRSCLVFEDSLAGVAAGIAAGSRVVGVSTTHTAAELSGCFRVIPDFAEITIDQLLPGD